MTGSFYQLVCALVILPNISGRILHHCRFVPTFYQTYPNIFQLNDNQTSLTVRPLYALTNQSFSPTNQTLSIGIIYRFAETYLVPVPFLFQCGNEEQIYAPKDCEFTIIDTRSDFTIRTTEATRTPTVPLNFYDYASSSIISLHGAYFKESSIALRNCRFISDDRLSISETFHLQIEFEQTIDSKCEDHCSHEELYECSSLSKTCQCRSHTIEKFHQLCVDTELASNCSRTPERCRHRCDIQKQLFSGQVDENCQCPLGTERSLFKNVYHCQLPKLIECDGRSSRKSCPNDFVCQDHRCVQVSLSQQIKESILPLPILLISLLVGALFIIVILIISLLKMRSVKCVKFIHPQTLSRSHSSNSSPATVTRLSTVHSSSSPCSTLSSLSKSMKITGTNKTLEKYSKIDLLGMAD